MIYYPPSPPLRYLTADQTMIQDAHEGSTALHVAALKGNDLVCTAIVSRAGPDFGTGSCCLSPGSLCAVVAIIIRESLRHCLLLLFWLTWTGREDFSCVCASSDPKMVFVVLCDVVMPNTGQQGGLGATRRGKQGRYDCVAWRGSARPC